MKHSKNSGRLPRALILLYLLLLSAACSGEGTKELREFAKVEAAIGMVAGASTFDRGIRLEQLAAIQVTSERVNALKTMCIAAYTSFDKAAALLESARQRTEVVEAEVKTLRARKEASGVLSPDDERRVLEMSASAATTLKSVTKELDVAEEKVAACQAKRDALRHKMANR